VLAPEALVKTGLIAGMVSLALQVAIALLPTTAIAQAPQLLNSWPTADLPIGIAIDPQGLAYVGTQFGGAVQVHVYNQVGIEVGSLGGVSPENYGLGFLRNGDVLVAEYYNRVVDVYSPGWRMVHPG
jgi:hypothetical protein